MIQNSSSIKKENTEIDEAANPKILNAPNDGNKENEKREIKKTAKRIHRTTLNSNSFF